MLKKLGQILTYHDSERTEIIQWTQKIFVETNL